MGGKNRVCEICGVKEKHRNGFFANFPSDENRCKEWVRVVGKQDLVHVPIEKLHEIRFVCGDHFVKKDFNKKGNRLLKRAIPKLNLSAAPLSEEQLEEFPLHVASKTDPDVQPGPSTKQGLPSTAVRDHEVQPGSLTSQQELIITSTQYLDVQPGPSTKQVLPSTAVRDHDYTTEVQPGSSTSRQELILPSTQHLDVQPGPSTKQVLPSTAVRDHDYTTEVQPGSSTSRQELILPSTQHLDVQPGPSTKQVLPSTAVRDHDYTTEVQPGSSTSRQELILPSTQQTTTKKRKYAELEKDHEIKKRKLEDNSNMTPRKKKLVAQLQKTKCTLSSLRKSAKLIEKINSPILKDLVAVDLKNTDRKPKGRRWTLKEKISALAIFKRSPKTYRYLAHSLMLPSIKTLQNLLRKIPMTTGINKAVLQHLQRISSTMDEKNKCCALLFDEMALKPRLVYNEATDQVDGYEDKGKTAETGRTDRIADHALVFMIQGLRTRYKQLIAYYFVKGTISSQQLAAYINQLIKAINETGFRVMVTVCDQGPTNMGALKFLKEHSIDRSGQFSGPIETRNFFITDNNKQIYIMYDIPHLFKSIRNNFMNHGQIQMGNYLGKWLYLFEVEEKNRSLLHLSKISAVHVRPKYRAKMKVKYAAQALSNTVSAVLKLISLSESDVKRKNEIMQTALIIEQLDRLFDCTNGPSCKDDVKRGQRQNVSAKTNHPQLWNDFRRKLSHLKFIRNDGTEATNVKCIQGMLMSLRTLQDVWNAVHTLGFRYLNLRSLNQDGLENFFGIIRQHSPTNRNPTCAGFIAALKTSVVSGMTAPHSRGSNCENDNQPLLTNFEDILKSEAEVQEHSDTLTCTAIETTTNLEAVLPSQFPELNIPEEQELDDETDLRGIKLQPLVYLSGYLASTLKNLNCAGCRSLLMEEDEQKQQAEIYQYIQLREWWDDKRSLTYPSLPLCRVLETAVNVFETEMIPRLHEYNISTLCTTLFVVNCDTTWFTCRHTKPIFDTIFQRLGHLLIRRQCHRINQKFAEFEERIKDVSKKAEQGVH